MINYNYSELNELNLSMVIIPFFKDVENQFNSIKIGDGQLSEVMDKNGFSMKDPLQVIVNQKILLLVPIDKDMPYDKIKDCFNKVGRDIIAQELQLYTNHLDLKIRELQSILHGLYLSQYNLQLYKKSEDEIERKIYVTTTLDKGEFLTLHEKALHVYQAQEVAMDMINAPSNKLSPNDLANLATVKLTPLGVNVKVFNLDQIEASGLHALVAVNRGSEEPARFIIMEYRSTTANDAPHFGLVGKGVTFDTGGLSLKNPANMHYMKSDLGGAASVLGAMMIIGQQKPNVHVTAIIPATDNSIGTLAIKPGDVIDSYLGKTIEVINTDAEGRLVLADGLVYMIKNYQPDYLMDLATLTGSIVMALGTHASGVFTHDDNIAEVLATVGDEIGERNWRMPLWDVYKEEMDSEIADIKNLATSPYAGSITAAKFLEQFTLDHSHWVHLDIAATVFGETIISKEKMATGYGPHLVYNWIEKMAESVSEKSNI